MLVTDLPEEILSVIFSFLAPRNVASAVSLSCRKVVCANDIVRFQLIVCFVVSGCGVR